MRCTWCAAAEDAEVVSELSDPETQGYPMFQPVGVVVDGQVSSLDAEPGSNAIGGGSELAAEERRGPWQQQTEDPQRCACCWRCIKRYATQEEATILWPFLWFDMLPQVACAAIVAVLFLAIGAGLSQVGGEEIVVHYMPGQGVVSFEIQEAISQDILVWYELTSIFLNQKDYVANKDSDIISSVLNKVACDGGDKRNNKRGEVRSRRVSPVSNINDSYFEGLIDAPGIVGSVFKPCGFIALSMFTDKFAFYKKVSANFSPATEDRIVAKEDDVALPSDKTIYDSSIRRTAVADDAAGIQYVVDGVDPKTQEPMAYPSWLRTDIYEHFKVWYRTPVSPHVRNLWARIPGGLPKGAYWMQITENSDVWTEHWGVGRKRVVLGAEHRLGSVGSRRILSVLCLVLGGAEALALAAFLGLCAAGRGRAVSWPSA